MIISVWILLKAAKGRSSDEDRFVDDSWTFLGSMATHKPDLHGLSLENDLSDRPSMREILDLLNAPEEAILNIYPYGSRLLGIARPDSGTKPCLTQLSMVC
jgi:hypothetical protein